MGAVRIAGILVALAGALLVPPAAQAAAPVSVTLYSERGDWVGGGGKQVLTPEHFDFDISGSNVYLDIWAFHRASPWTAHLRFAPPRGQVLAPGVYDHAERLSFRSDGRPGIDVGVDRYGCNDITGRFEVKELELTPGGVLRRLWILYEQHCEGATPALSGEIRIGAVGPRAADAMAPAEVRWPIVDRGHPSDVVPVRLIAPEPLEVSAVDVAGEHPGSFAIEEDGCTGVVLAAGERCVVRVGYLSDVAGTRAAVLRVTDRSGAVHETMLGGHAIGGRTRMVVHEWSKDPYNDDRHTDYDAGDAAIVAGTSFDSLWFSVRPEVSEQTEWTAQLWAAPGEELVVGRTYHDTDVSGSGRPRLEVSPEGSTGCGGTGTFTVHELTRDELGKVRSAGFEFDQRCPSWYIFNLTGTFEFRAGDTTPAAPWTGSFGPGTTGPVIDVTAVQPRGRDEPPGEEEPPGQEEPPGEEQPPGQPQTPAAPGPGSGSWQDLAPIAPGTAPPTVSDSPVPAAGGRRLLRVGRHGRVRVPVSCPRRPCRGVVRLRSRGRVLAERRFHTRTLRPRVTLRLSPRLARRLRAGGRRRALVVIRLKGRPPLRVPVWLRAGD